MRLTLLLLLLQPALRAQPASPDRLQFEVASVRIAPPITGGVRLITEAEMKQGGPGTAYPERISYRAVGLRYLILQAYGIRALQLALPDQFKFRSTYDIAANIPPGTTKEQFNTMMQNLLADRFGMRFHREPKQFDAYKLVIAGGGPKLRDTTIKTGVPQSAHQDPDGSVFAPGMMFTAPRDGRLVFSGGKLTSGVLADYLEHQLNGPVTDATGLTGEYDIKLEFSPEGLTLVSATAGALGNSSVPAPNIFQALERQLGLKLEKSKVTLDMLVVDHLDEAPTDN